MRIHPVKIGNVEGTAIENTPIGSICIVPTVLDKDIILSHDDKMLIEKKKNLLCNLLKDEQFLSEVASLYKDQLNFPLLLVSFDRFHEDNRGVGFGGDTSNNILDINEQEGKLLELNFLDADTGLRDVDRLFYLWKNFFSLALCHSPSRPDDNNKVMNWSESQAKRAWLLAIKKEKIKNPRKKFERKNEHLYPEPIFDDILEYGRFPPWKWNNTSGFVDVFETHDRGLIADIHIATTMRKIIKHGSIEPARSTASSGKIFRFFNNFIWEKALVKGNINEKLEIFLELLDKYIECVFNWDVDIDQFRPLISKINI